MFKAYDMHDCSHEVYFDVLDDCEYAHKPVPAKKVNPQVKDKLTKRERKVCPIWATHFKRIDTGMCPAVTVFYGEDKHQIMYHETGRLAPMRHGTVTLTDVHPVEKPPMWCKANGQEIAVSKMTSGHLKNALALLHRAPDPNDAAIAMLEREVEIRGLQRKINSGGLRSETSKQYKKARGSTQLMECYCGQQYKARTADLKRGWATSCSKACAALKRERGLPDAKLVRGQ